MISSFSPPLINSSNRWATTYEDLRELYECPHTGGITTRTSLIDGFPHNDSVHQHTFFQTSSTHSQPNSKSTSLSTSSLNTLGYSPHPLSVYIQHANELDSEFTGSLKPFIFSVTGSAQEIVQCRDLISSTRTGSEPSYMEINLSCPNIANKPPPAYDASALMLYLETLKSSPCQGPIEVIVGIKTPPYTYHDQYVALIEALQESCEPDGKCPVQFITATNTLGSSLDLSRSSTDDGKWVPTLNSANGSGIGGLAGAALHPLALGNVSSIRTMLDELPVFRDIEIIGVGGVEDGDGFARMMSVGAKVVGVGTAFGLKGVQVFGEILGSQTDS